MVSDAGHVTLLDFGIAKQRPDRQGLTRDADRRRSHATRRGDRLVPYMSPEQAQGHAIDARSDVFGFGVLVYEMLTGRRPFSGSTSLETVAKILEATPAAVEAIRTDVPRPCDADRVVPREGSQPASAFRRSAPPSRGDPTVARGLDPSLGAALSRRGSWFRWRLRSRCSPVPAGGGGSQAAPFARPERNCLPCSSSPHAATHPRSTRRPPRSSRCCRTIRNCGGVGKLHVWTAAAQQRSARGGSAGQGIRRAGERLGVSWQDANRQAAFSSGDARPVSEGRLRVLRRNPDGLDDERGPGSGRRAERHGPHSEGQRFFRR